MKTVIYARTTAENKVALEKRLKQCREFCDAYSLTVVAEIHEFGNIPARPGLAKLRRLIEEGQVEAVVVTSIDRLNRKVNRVAELVNEIEQAGVQLKFMKGE
jgi:DNA invertase Pin-like site-specific DNA recombinase